MICKPEQWYSRSIEWTKKRNHLKIILTNLLPEITESQKVWLEGNTLSPVVQPCCSVRVIPEHITHDCVQKVLECLQWGRLHRLSGQSAPVHSHCTVKSFLMFKWQFLCISSCPLPLLLSLGTTRAWIHPLDTFPSGNRQWWGPWPILRSDASSKSISWSSYWKILLSSILNPTFPHFSVFYMQTWFLPWPWKLQTEQLTKYDKNDPGSILAFLCMLDLWFFHCRYLRGLINSIWKKLSLNCVVLFSPYLKKSYWQRNKFSSETDRLTPKDNHVCCLWALYSQVDKSKLDSGNWVYSRKEMQFLLPVYGCV